MKRSEVLNILSQLIYDNHTSWGDSGYSVDCNKILLGLEETGIIRPIKNISNSETLVINQFGQVVSKAEDSEVIEIGWEDESSPKDLNET